MSLRKRQAESSSGDPEWSSKIRKPSDCSVVEAEDERINHINQLPLEVLDIILSYLSRRVRQNVRLVCKLWYDRGHFDEKLFIKPRKHEGLERRSYYRIFEHPLRLEACGFKRINLHFQWTNMTNRGFPVSLWEGIGLGIHSLKLYACRLGNQVVKNIFSHCENLQVLEIGLAHYDLDESFCSLETLEKLNVVQKKLHTLDIYHSGFCNLWGQRENIDIQKWERIFCVLRQIFPSITHYRSSSELCSRHGSSFRIKFSLESAISKVDESDLYTALGYSMSLNNSVDWRRALQALSTVSLTSVSLELGLVNYEKEDADALVNFFTNQKKLKRIELELRENMIKYDDKNGVVIPPDILLSILFHILENCSQLREFYFFNDWFSHLKERQYVEVVTKTSRLTQFTINNLLVEGFTMRLRNSFSWGASVCTEISTLAPYYSHVQHLILRNSKMYSDAILNICKYMINLKTLEIDVTNWIFQKGTFKRLQNLERLIIHFSDEHTRSKNRDWFEEFEFPKLRYLYCLLPEEASLLDCIGTKLPVLEEVDFSQTDCATINYFRVSQTDCGSINYFREYPPDIVQDVDVTSIFARCPTLRSFRYYRGTYFYEQFTRKIIFTEK